MYARVELHTNRVGIERLLAIAVAVCVAAVRGAMSPDTTGVLALGLAPGRALDAAAD